MNKRLLRGLNGAALAGGCVAALALLLLSIDLPSTRPLPAVEAASAGHDEHEEHVPGNVEKAPELSAEKPVDDCCPTPTATSAGKEAEPAAADAPGHEHEHAASAEHDVPWCGEHDVAEDECGICQPARTAVLKPGEGLKIRMASSTGMEEAGVHVGAPQMADLAGEAVHLARATYNLDRLAHVSPRLPGVIEEVLAGPGDQVEKGAPLIRISSAEVAEARSALKSAEAEESFAAEIFAREKMLWEKEVSSTQEYRSAEAALKQARIQVQLAREALQTAGVRPEDLANAVSGSLLTVRAPLDGTIVDWHAVVGESVDSADTIATIADLTNMWLELAIPATAISKIQAGDHVHARFEGLENLEIEGLVDWIASQVDLESRTIAARAVVPNPGAALRDGMTGKVSIRQEESTSALGVPVDAVQEYDGKPYVFLKLTDDLYEVRQVKLGAREQNTVAVLDGIAADDQIVVARSFTVKSEFLKSRLGAGCADH